VPPNQAESEQEGHFSVRSVKTQCSEYVQARNGMMHVLVKVADELKPGRNPNKSLIVLLATRALTRVGEPLELQWIQTPEFRAQRLWNTPHASITIVESREEN
jgi:hypothetical protein